MASPLENQRFGELLRRHRSRSGLTQQELADFSTISVRAIRDLEHGRALYPRKDTLRLLGEALRLGDRDREDLLAAAGRRRGHAVSLCGPDAVASPPPVVGTPLLGREQEAAALAMALAAPGRRLVTVTGAPGAGKSRLVVEVAQRYHRSSGLPVLWAAGADRGFPVPAGELADLVERAVAGLFTRVAPVADGDHAVAELARAVGDQPALLVLDAPRPGPPDAELLARLLRDCSALRVLTVADHPYGQPGETVFPLSALTPAAAVDVLVWHLGDTRLSPSPGPEEAPHLAEICALLDRLPGALVCAATWLTLYDPASLLACLRDDPLPFLSPLTGPAGPGLADGLLRMSAALTPEEEAVLDLLCVTADGERADGLARIGGLPLAECGRALNGLITRGLVRCERGTGQARVHTLNLMRVLRAAHAPRNPSRVAA